MCGIGAVAHKSDNISCILYEILFNLQHRGQDSSGMLSYDFKTKITHELKDFGLVDKHIKQLSELSGTMGIGHVRYPTQGLITKNEIQRPSRSNACRTFSRCLLPNTSTISCDMISRSFLVNHASPPPI